MPVMTISAANVAPDFSQRRKIHADELRELQEPAVIFEHEGLDSDGVRFFVYTVAGWLNGQNIATMQGGCTVGGECIIINAERREDADDMACMGLQDTIDALNREDEMIVEAMVARERLNTVGTLDRMDLATKPEKNPEFIEDMAKARTLVGDDIVLTTGG